MRIKISKQDSEIIDSLTSIFGFKTDGVIARVAFAYSLQLEIRFDLLDDLSLASDGKDWRDESALFGTSGNDHSYSVVYRSLLNQHYNTALTEESFIKLFKRHLNFGLEKIYTEVNANFANSNHVEYLMSIAKRGLDVVSNASQFGIYQDIFEEPAFDKVVEISIGHDALGEKIALRINDLKEFDSCNIAIAGMVGSGKTELVKDLLYQMSNRSDNELKFIFFDYKGEGDASRLNSFLQSTGCEMVDLRKGALDLNPLSFINLADKRSQSFNIKSFVDFVCNIATQLGVTQKHTLQSIIIDCFNAKSNKNVSEHPSLIEVQEELNNFYTENKLKPDSLTGIIADLANNIFSGNSHNKGKLYHRSLYVNLPLELSDTLRQLCVFLTLKYLLAEFSSMNDTEPTDDRIKPLRYIIVIDEAHVYLKNRNASKALEDILRVLRSKGVVIIMLTQGVEDYKTKNFDFSSQIKIPICLNVNNKDYRLIESFVGTPRSKQKLLEAIGNLEPQKAIINLGEPQVIKINQFWQTIKEV